MYKNINEEAIKEYYSNYDEDSRLVRSRHGQLEYRTTMAYIHKYLKKPSMKVLEVGAGTGRYSIALAKEGFDVTAVELVDANLKILKDNSKGVKNLHAMQGDALDLSRFSDSTFDMVLVLGPLYHLYTKQDQKRAIDEALRVCKKGGVVMFAFIPIHNFVVCYGMEGGHSVSDTILENFTEDFKPKQFPEQMFTGFEIDKFKNLFRGKPFKKLHLVSVDAIMDIEESRQNFSMSDEEFDLYFKYHLATCENATLQGFASHLLYIGKKY